MADLDDLTDDSDDMPSAPFWMVTFSDMVTLLLTFFVLIVAMSEVEIKKFEEALSYFHGRSSVMNHDAMIPPVRKQPIVKVGAEDQARRYEELLAYLQENDLDDKVQVNLTEKGLHVVITDSIMFRSGEAMLIDPSREILRVLAATLDDVEAVVVEGHTDTQPIHTVAYPSNWELSGARASSVVRYLLEQTTALTADRYVAIGYGEHRPKVGNDSPEGRAQNRRVEIYFSWEPWQNPLTESTTKSLRPTL